MNSIGPQLERASDCEAVLRSLPKWFGIEHTLLMYVEDTTKLPTFAMDCAGQILGFLTLRAHFPEAWEVHCMAVRAEARGKKIGAKLLAHSEHWLRQRNVKFLQVKTVAANSKNVEYAETRKFYEAMGFTPVEVFPELWDPWNPALQCIKSLNAA